MISIIIPIYNEAENIHRLFETLLPNLRSLGHPFEVIAVNDGSQDATWERLTEIATLNTEVKALSLQRNSGQTAALQAGIDYSKGDVLIPIDADLQNDPADIGLLLGLLDQGYDVVSGWRKDRQDAELTRNFPSRVANRLISWVSGVHLHDYGCSLKAYRRSSISGVRLYGEMHRFLPIYASWHGARVTEVPVRHHPRRYGISKYGLERVFKVLLDLMVVKFLDRYLTKPIYVFGGFGAFSLTISGLALAFALWLKFFKGTSLILTPLPLFSAMTFLIGMVAILMGLLAEVIVRIYFETQDRRSYLVRDRLNFPRD